VLQGGWKNYRRWVRDGLESLPPRLSFKVLSGSTGSGKTRLLAALERAGEQVLDLEALAAHRGSLIGGLPGVVQPSQKFFETQLLDRLRTFDPDRPVWVEDESRKIGAIQIPEAMFGAIRRGDIYNVEAPMAERVRLWREDYPQLVADPIGMVEKLKPVRGLVGGEEYEIWQTTAARGATDELFERVMVQHYDPCYLRSMRKERTRDRVRQTLRLKSLSDEALDAAARTLITEEGQGAKLDECR
jgi:tRNA 2-selenouridine synthase